MSPLIAIAAEVGAPFVQKILQRQIGGAAGDLAADVVGQIARDMGTTPERLDAAIEADPQAAKVAIERVEAAAPEMIALYAQGLEGQFKLAEAETKSERFLSWAWRPLGMWGLGGLWFWNVILLHIANAYWKIALPPMDFNVLMQLTAVYSGLYMGGHTIKNVVSQAKGDRG